LFGLVLPYATVLVGSDDVMLHLLDDVQVILDVLQAAVVGEFLEQRLDFLFRGTHRAVSVVVSVDCNNVVLL
jgi:hypothetical protein